MWGARRVAPSKRCGVMIRDAVIMRVSSHLAGLLEPKLAREGRPFGLEVVNDPYDVFAPGAVRTSCGRCSDGGSRGSCGASARTRRAWLT